MNKQAGFAPIIILLVILIAGGIVGGGVYISKQQEKAAKISPMPMPVTEEVKEEKNSDTVSSEITASFMNLLGRNQSLECDWNPPGMMNVRVSKVWINGTMGRSHIESSDPTGNMDIVADAIFKNDEVTTWVEAGPAGKIGFKMTKSEIEKANTGLTAEQKKQAETYMKDTKYSCKPWTVDASKFEVPADVKFYK